MDEKKFSELNGFLVFKMFIREKYYQKKIIKVFEFIEFLSYFYILKDV